MLRVFLFGAPRLEHGDRAVPLRRTKALALLAYLATTGRPQDRDTLTGLLWPEFDEASARNNLRRELSLLRASLGEEVLVADRLQVAWNPRVEAWVDIAAFQERVAAWSRHRHAHGELCAECAAALAAAAQLCRDDFLAGFGMPDSPAFEEWQFFQRETLRQQLAGLLQALVVWHDWRREHDPAIAAARRWLALDPLHEPAQRELMRLYALSGQHSAALRQYEECARLLDRELGAAPDPETAELYEDIKARRVSAPPALAPGPLPAADRPARREHAHHNLPPPLAGFVGRERELADIIRRLTDPACRLLTLVGPGGIGKTRLAIRAARWLAEGWAGEDALADGVLFVPLAQASDLDGLAAAIASAARFDFHPHVSPQQQVLDYFRDKRMLLLLDNFEQLLEAAGFVGQLVALAPHVRVLATSRMALNLQEEWFHAVDGLSFPSSGEDISSVAQLARFDAVRLFEQSARRAQSDFSLVAVRDHVVRLCRLVEGTPLALELAAAWLKLLPVEQVVVALERDLDILTTRDTNIPERHRSMRAVLDESWRLLSERERQAFALLSIFRGEFGVQGAAAVAGASLDMLAALADRALLRRLADGRFQLHELPRQYAEERLRQASNRAAVAEERHSRFFAELAERAQAELHGPQQQGWVARLSADHDNLRAALRRAEAAGDSIMLLRLAGALWQFWNIRGYRSEGRAWLRSAIELSQPAQAQPAIAALRARALRGAGTLALNQDDYAAAREHFSAGLAACERLDDLRGVEMALNNLGLVELYHGRLAAARAYFERSLALAPQSGDEWNRDAATHNLALVLAQQGDMDGAGPLFEQSLALSRARGDTLGILISLVDYALALANDGDYAQARALASEALDLSRSADNAQLASDALGVLGQVAVLQGEGARARPLLEQALALSHDVDEGKSPPCRTLVYLGMALLAEANIPDALERLREALTNARTIANGSQIVLALQGLACVAAVCGDVLRAARLFGATEAQARAHGQALPPAEYALILPYVRATRAALDFRGFAAAWTEGQRLAGEAAYRLALEVGWQPLAEPRPGELRHPAATPIGQVANNLPPQLTPFVGREQELAALEHSLDSSRARLVTIVGPGGIGKTRLALAAAERYLREPAGQPAGQAPRFPDGIFFVPLAAIGAAEQLVPAIATALSMHLDAGGPPGRSQLRQLIEYLRARALLLLLDNFEHLLEGAGLLSEIVAGAPAISLLVTSREALNLQEEWQYRVAGMAVPATAAGDVLLVSDAAQLFVERARRVRPSFDHAAEGPAVRRICQLADGMPLAIELAASWAKILPCAAIADEIARNLGFLETSQRNMPERHRSIRATFDQSWARLDDAERAIFMRLAVFHGGFTHVAAQRIAGAALPTLAALADKSLIHSEADGRYHMHELLRQYAEERLRADAQGMAQVQAAFDSFYVVFLAQRFEDVLGGRQVAAIAEISAELENIRIAWRRTVERGDAVTLDRAGATLASFYDFRGLYLEAQADLELVVGGLRDASPTPEQAALLALMLVYLGWAAIRVGNLTQAASAFEESAVMHARLNMAPQRGLATDPLLGHGVLALISGDYAEAARLGEAARQRGEAQRHRANLYCASYVLSNAALAQGQLQTAQQYAQQAYAATQFCQDRWFSAYCLNQLGNIAAALGAYDDARKHYAASYALRAEFHDREGMALALVLLGKVALQQAAYDDARQHYQRSLAIYREIGDRGGLATALNGFGLAECALGAADRASAALREALLIAADMRYTALVLAIAASVAELLLRSERFEQAAELLMVCSSHPSGDRDTLDRCGRLLERCRSRLAPEVLGVVAARAGARDFDALVAQIQSDLGLAASWLPLDSPADTAEARNTIMRGQSPNPPLPQPLAQPGMHAHTLHLLS